MGPPSCTPGGPRNGELVSGDGGGSKGCPALDCCTSTGCSIVEEDCLHSVLFIACGIGCEGNSADVLFQTALGARHDGLYVVD